MKANVVSMVCVVLLALCGPRVVNAQVDVRQDALQPAAFDLEAARKEVAEKYAAAHPEVQEYILWTAKSFGPSGMWLNENAFAVLTPEEREKKTVYLAALLEDGEYGRHLCEGLAQAGAVFDPRLVPGLIKVAAHHEEGVDYDCRPKWMAAAALARQESGDAVPTLIELVDHGNQNTRMWARAALARKAGSGGKDFKDDKAAWKKWWGTAQAGSGGQKSNKATRSGGDKEPQKVVAVSFSTEGGKLLESARGFCMAWW